MKTADLGRSARRKLARRPLFLQPAHASNTAVLPDILEPHWSVATMRGWLAVFVFALSSCATIPPPTWTARVTGTIDASFTGSVMIAQKGGALVSNSLQGRIPRNPDGSAGWAEYTIVDGSAIVSATYINMGGASASISAEILKGKTVVASGHASGPMAMILLNP